MEETTMTNARILRSLGPIHSLAVRAKYRWLPNFKHAWTNVFGYRPIKIDTLNYDDYWNLDASAFPTDIRADVYETIVQPGSSVADIGCGDGRLLARLRDRKGATVHGYDVSTVAVQKTQARGVPAEVWDASTDAFPDTFDYVIIADCMEHVPAPEQLIERVRTRFRKALLISIPNSCYWRYRARVLFGKFMVQWVAHPGEHLRFWSISDMHWWLGQHHFRIERAYPTWGIPVLKHIWPAMFAQNLIYVVHDNNADRSA